MLCIFVSAVYLKYPLEYNHDTSQLCRTGQDDVSRTRMTTLTSIFPSHFFLMVSDAISCPLHNLKTIRNIFMILDSYVEQVMTMCRKQEWQLSLTYCPSYLSLIVTDAYLCLLHNLNTVWNIIMILQLCRTGHDDLSRTRMTTLAFIPAELFPLIVADTISCPLHNLKPLGIFQ